MGRPHKEALFVRVNDRAMTGPNGRGRSFFLSTNKTFGGICIALAGKFLPKGVVNSFCIQNHSVKKIISLACVSSETHNLQRVFHPAGGSPLYRLCRYVPRQRVCFF